MANLLEGRELYIAGAVDAKMAQILAEERARGREVSEEDFRRYVREEFTQLWQGRIDRGEVPDLKPEPIRIVDRTSEAA